MGDSFSSFKNTQTESSKLDPDQDWCFAGSGLGLFYGF